jgi:hypothetical protein
MMGVVELVDGLSEWDDEPTWDEAAAAFGTGTPVQLARPERKVTIRYRYEDGHCKATSPQVTGFEVIGADLQETRALVRQKLDAWLDPAVELDEIMPISQAGVAKFDSQYRKNSYSLVIRWPIARMITGAIFVVASIATAILLIRANHVYVGVANWLAIAAAVVALVAVYFNAQSSRAAIRAAKAAEEQIEVQWHQHMEAVQPYVWVDIRPDNVTGTLLNFVIGNSGPTTAMNVRVEVDPPLPAIEELEERAAAAQARLAAGLSSLAPTRVLTWPLGQGFNLLSGSAPKRYRFTVSADGPFGPVPPRAQIIDLEDLRGTLDRPSPIYQLTKAVEKLSSRLEE